MHYKKKHLSASEAFASATHSAETLDATRVRVGGSVRSVSASGPVDGCKSLTRHDEGTRFVSLHLNTALLLEVMFLQLERKEGMEGGTEGRKKGRKKRKLLIHLSGIKG